MWDSGRLTGNAGGDDDDVGILEGSLDAVVLGEVSRNDLVESSVMGQLPRTEIAARAGPRGSRTAGEEMWDRSAATPGVLTTS